MLLGAPVADIPNVQGLGFYALPKQTAIWAYEGFMGFQRAQHPLVKEDTKNHNIKPCVM